MRDVISTSRVLAQRTDRVIRANDLARVMVDVVVRETLEQPGPIFENREIRALAAKRD
jgi:phosphoribosyl-dephospho-CoA transferase